MLEVAQLQLAYQNQHWCWDFSLPAGSCLAVTGASGVGKSSLLLALAGALPNLGGEVYWHGQALSALPLGQRPMSLLFQRDNLFAHLTVAQNLTLVFADSGKSAAQQQRLLAVAQRLGIDELLTRKPNQLSGGQQQRVALARMCLLQRPIVLLDEPFSALDPQLREQGMVLVDELRRSEGLTVILVTHQWQEVAPYCDYQLHGDGERWCFSANERSAWYSI